MDRELSTLNLISFEMRESLVYHVQYTSFALQKLFVNSIDWHQAKRQ